MLDGVVASTLVIPKVAGSHGICPKQPGAPFSLPEQPLPPTILQSLIQLDHPAPPELQNFFTGPRLQNILVKRNLQKNTFCSP